MRQNSSENTAKNSSVRGSCVKPSLAKVGGPVQKRDWTHNKTVVQFCGMWRSFAALLLLATPVYAQENAAAKLRAHHPQRLVSRGVAGGGRAIWPRRAESCCVDYRSERRSAGREMENYFGKCRRSC